MVDYLPYIHKSVQKWKECSLETGNYLPVNGVCPEGVFGFSLFWGILNREVGNPLEFSRSEIEAILLSLPQVEKISQAHYRLKE